MLFLFSCTNPNTHKILEEILAMMKTSKWIKRYICYNYSSQKNDFDRIFLLSDKILNRKAMGKTNKQSNIYLSSVFTFFYKHSIGFRSLLSLSLSLSHTHTHTHTHIYIYIYSRVLDCIYSDIISFHIPLIFLRFYLDISEYIHLF